MKRNIEDDHIEEPKKKDIEITHSTEDADDSESILRENLSTEKDLDKKKKKKKKSKKSEKEKLHSEELSESKNLSIANNEIKKDEKLKSKSGIFVSDATKLNDTKTPDTTSSVDKKNQPWTDWGKASFDGDQARKDKFLKLMGYKKSNDDTSKDNCNNSSSKFVSMNDLERDFLQAKKLSEKLKRGSKAGF
ncbi:hypothetical protein HDU92_006991 [Lobulomyces angularis]|nr:hypothetical protein HDU92_006991 [Lobulomyces angularis]